MKNKTCCFTGHRPNKLFGYDLSNPNYQKIAKCVKQTAKLLYLNHNVKNFISGAALGFDTVCFFAIESLKKEYPDIQNILAIPFANQGNNWVSDVDKNRLNRMKQLADNVIQVEKINKYYSQTIGGKLNNRNHYMVDNSDYVIACWNGTSGGTKNCIDYAQNNNKTILNIMK